MASIAALTLKFRKIIFSLSDEAIYCELSYLLQWFQNLCQSRCMECARWIESQNCHNFSFTRDHDSDQLKTKYSKSNEMINFYRATLLGCFCSSHNPKLFWDENWKCRTITFASRALSVSQLSHRLTHTVRHQQKQHFSNSSDDRQRTTAQPFVS